MSLPPYNTAKGPLLLSQYGRGVQTMVERLLTLESKAARQRGAETIVKIMAAKAAADGPKPSYQSLWDHLAYMSGYKLDIDYPFPVTRIGEEGASPKPLAYPKNDLRQRQYGQLLERAIARLDSLPPGREREKLLAIVANRMKQTLADWNRDAMDDHRVAVDLKVYTQGRVALPAGFTFAKVDTTPLTSGTTGKKKRRRKKF